MMITRLYAHNFRCLVAFTSNFDSFDVLCGPNGSGKSSIFDALRLLRDLGSGDGVLGGNGEQDVPQLERTDWIDSPVQEFELGLRIDGREFEYRLHLEQREQDERPRVIKEHAACDGKVLFRRDLENVEFEKADGSKASFPLDWRQAALAAIQPRAVNLRPLALLQEEIARLLIVRPNPRSMERESRAEVKQPDLSMTKLSSWFRNLFQDQEWTNTLTNSLKVIWPDFRSFRLVDAGMNTKALQLSFGNASGRPTVLFADQLSDGERALLGLYMIRATVETGAVRTVMLDEPDNFVGLPELQPWVLSMRELLDERHQLVLISHHPEILSVGGEANGRYLWRDDHTSPARIGTLQVPKGLSAGEAIARGWASGK
jgi:energy-coupling factor transporter ATP-binding protein EcfA2